MNTEQNYVGKGSNATFNPETAQNEAQITSEADNRPIPDTNLTTPVSRPYTRHDVQLRVSFVKSGDNMSEAELIYWGLQSIISDHLKTVAEYGEDDPDSEDAQYCITKAREVQDTLFGLVCDQASTYWHQAVGAKINSKS